MGRFLVVNAKAPPGGEFDMVSLDSTHLRTPIAITTGGVLAQRVSPDGRWLAYESNESGAIELYVRAIPGLGGLHQVSSGGGNEPVWGPSGHELFFRARGRLIVATLATAPEFTVVRRDTLFVDQYAQRDRARTPGSANYDVSPEGKHFVMVQAAGTGEPPIVVLGWLDELRERMALAAKK